ncbi:hypothetical protein F989_01182 [Acinetobacter parvus NIPH 1103]|uniref:Uncharacterized protein n=1 Tax=Acinetobacter parvus NIPH 1103 TaxID=1217671 RepID=N8Q5N9_9GAMM|nr:hypothetical protein F989_01182 [Acinetobacter parvus NIPH 1103]
MTGTVKLHRVFKAPAERVFKAFLVPDALAKWMAAILIFIGLVGGS